jgi:hypothetical protein
MPHLTATGTSAAFRFPETKPDDHCGEWHPRKADELIERRDK